MIRMSARASAGIRASLRGSSRHSSTLRPMRIAPGTSPSTMRCSSGRMSTSAAPSVSAANAASGRSRRRPLRASASRSSMPGASVGSESLLSLAADALAPASAVSAPPRPRPPSGPSIATVSRGDQAVVGRRVIGHRHQRRRVRVNAGRRRAAAVRDVVDVAGPERDRLAVRQPPPARAGRSAPGTARPGCPRRPRTTRTTRRGHASRCPGHVPRPAARRRTRSTGAAAGTSARPGRGRPGPPQSPGAPPAPW